MIKTANENKTKPMDLFRQADGFLRDGPADGGQTARGISAAMHRDSPRRRLAAGMGADLARQGHAGHRGHPAER